MDLAVLSAGALFALAACGGGGDESADDTSAGEGTTLTVYSGRDEELVGPLFEQFQTDTGITVEVRYGDSAELAATLAEEGDSSPADVFLAQDAGALGAVAAAGLLAELPEDATASVDPRFVDPDNRWVGISGRARVLAYNSELVSETELPPSVLDLTDERWKGKIGVAPTNASFQAFVTALRLAEGDDAARGWLEALQANDPKIYEGNSPILEALAAGEVELGLVNHYYLYALKDEQPGATVANHFFAGGDPGALVNVAGVGVLASGATDASEELVTYLLDPEKGQAYFADTTAEYPLVEGTSAGADLVPLDQVQGPDLALGDLGPELENTLVMLNEVGLTS